MTDPTIDAIGSAMRLRLAEVMLTLHDALEASAPNAAHWAGARAVELLPPEELARTTIDVERIRHVDPPAGPALDDAERQALLEFFVRFRDDFASSSPEVAEWMNGVLIDLVDEGRRQERWWREFEERFYGPSAP